MQSVCPITDKRINEQVARMNALFTIFLVLLFVIFNFWPGMVFLALDFMLRGFIDGKYSLLTIFSKTLAKGLDLPPRMINAGPKIFAAQVGLFISLIILSGYALNLTYLYEFMAAILGIFSFLESAFGICVACKLYPIIRKS